MKYLFPIVAILLIAGSAKFALDLYQIQSKKTEIQYDYAEINRINYGLFNIQLWKDKAMSIFESKVNDFKISPQLYTSLEKQIDTYANEAYEQYFSTKILAKQIQENLEDSKIPKMFLKMFSGDIEKQIEKFDIKGKLPQLTKQISKEIKKNEPEIKAYVQNELLNAVMGDEETRYIEKRKVIYYKYGLVDQAETHDHLSEKLVILESEIDDLIKRSLALLAGAILLLLIGLKWSKFNLTILGLTLGSVVFLLLGVTMPMIDIDARLNSFKMNLMGANIEFDEQVLYFQSKSIFDVTQTLWQGSGWDLKLVGALIFLFSIVFPFLKLVLSTGYLFSDKVKSSKIAKTVIFYLGKWSMADVFVVAIFMAYIGFYGIVTSQLGAIGQNQTGYAVETINYSKLSPGALFFTCYCILSIITSIIIARVGESDDTSVST